MSILIYSRTPLMMQAPCFSNSCPYLKHGSANYKETNIEQADDDDHHHHHHHHHHRSQLDMFTNTVCIFLFAPMFDQQQWDPGRAHFLHSTANHRSLPDYSGIFWICLFPWQNNRANEQNLQLGSTQTYHWQDSTQA